MNEQEKRQEEATRLERQQREQHTAEGRQLTERQLTEERQRQETQRMQDEHRRQDSQRQENQRREDERRREEERRRQEQRAKEEQRKQESQSKEDRHRTEQPREQGGESTLHESTVRTMQDGKDSKDGRTQSEQSTIEYGQKNGVPIAVASLSASGRSQSEGKPMQGDKPDPTEQKKTAKTEEPKATEKGGFAARREALKTKVQETLKAQEQGKTHDLGRGR